MNDLMLRCSKIAGMFAVGAFLLNARHGFLEGSLAALFAFGLVFAGSFFLLKLAE